MKTRYTILCAFAVILALSFIACDTPHSYSDTWSYNATQHWRECTNDGAKTDIADHTGDPCTVCGYTSSGPGIPHTHTYATTWSFNAAQHWRECTANDGAKTDEAAHTGGVCTVCGYDSSEPLVTFATNNPLTANGNTTTTTTTLTFTLSEAIPGLTASDITLSGVTGVTKGTLSGAGPTYTLPISGFTSGGTLTVTITKTGYNISGSQTVTIYYYHQKTDSDTFVLGETGPGGGKIFYYSAAGFTMTDNSQICHYLEAAPNDMATTLAWTSIDYRNTNTGATAEAIGTGRKNTADILATDANAPAAKACDDYSNGGKTDWFLPSRYELNQLYVNRTSVGNMVTTSPSQSTYWSSSERTNLSAASIDFYNSGQMVSTAKTENWHWVRAIRAF
jgi:hypothetical protein